VGSWQNVIYRVAVTTALLAGVAVTLKYPLPDLAPLACTAIVFQCAHQYQFLSMCQAQALHGV
jgi:hypothetical protein